ncbi:MAG: GH116 family glycosyl hydrolase [Dermatophilaceae bacterium]
MKVITTPGTLRQARSGHYLGGIGAGGFDLHPSGACSNNHIERAWNNDDFFDSCFLFENTEEIDPAQPPAGLVRRALRVGDFSRNMLTVEGEQRVEFTSEFPKVRLHHPEVGITVDYLSYFIPGNVKDSSLPVVTMKVKGAQRGRLMFLFPFCGTPEVSGNQVTIRNGGRSLTLHSKRGQAFARKRYFFFYFSDFDNPLYTWEPQDTPDEYFAGVFLKGDVDDEITLTWHNPQWIDKAGVRNRFYYTTFFRDSEQVLAYARSEQRRLEAETLRFHESIWSTNQPTYLKDAYAAQLNSLVKSSWLGHNGDFGVWEGSNLSCCLETVDVSYYGSWLYLQLFPELDTRAKELIAVHQRADGHIPHGLAGTFGRHDQYGRCDLNSQFILQLYRNYYVLGDEQLLTRHYGVMRKAWEQVYDWDEDGDLIPEVSHLKHRDTTFDAMTWEGMHIYVATLWLATLKVMAAAARVMGDTATQHRAERDFAVVQSTVIEKFFNGHHFVMMRSGGDVDEGCLVDALSGDWYSRLCGLGPVLPEALTRAHLDAVWRLNRTRVDLNYMTAYTTPGETGWLVTNVGYADGRIPSGGQQYESWTGLEYTLAAHYWLLGDRRKARRVVRDVQERKARSGTSFNHRECGGNYFRPMSIGMMWELATGRLPVSAPGDRDVAGPATGERVTTATARRQAG